MRVKVRLSRPDLARSLTCRLGVDRRVLAHLVGFRGQDLGEGVRIWVRGSGFGLG